MQTNYVDWLYKLGIEYSTYISVYIVIFNMDIIIFIFIQVFLFQAQLDIGSIKYLDVDDW